MSAVEEYRKVTADDGGADGRDWDAVIPAADAAIAELEQQADELDAEIASLQWKLGEKGLI